MTPPKGLFEEIQQAVADLQPELEIKTNETYVLLEGRFVLSGMSGPFDFYDVKVRISPEYPIQEPIVFETGKRIPKEVDRHIFPNNENCCLGVWDEWLLTSSDHSFQAFLTGPMRDYFLSQSHFEATGEWPFGERSHGNLGVLEAYCSLLDIEQDHAKACAYLRLLTYKEIKGHHSCPCGSGKKLRDCHRSELNDLQNRIPAFFARRMYKRMIQS